MINMSKGISKKNEAKLKIYLSKVNEDSQRTDKKNSNAGAGAQANQKIQNGSCR